MTMAEPKKPIDNLLRIMAALRAPDGCPWDREQDHRSLRWHAVEEVYELMDAIEAGDDQEMAEELGDLLLQVVFHCQLARERGAFDFDVVCRKISEKLVRRHPHVFGESNAADIDAIWAQWERIKRAEKQGTRFERHSALDGVPGHLPALMRAEKLVRKAVKAGLDADLEGTASSSVPARSPGKRELGPLLFRLVTDARRRGWSAEALLRSEVARQEKRLRRLEKMKMKQRGTGIENPIRKTGSKTKTKSRSKSKSQSGTGPSE